MKSLSNLHQWYHWSFKYELRKKKERALTKLVWHLPESVVYWSAIRVGANATTGKYSNQVVPNLLFMDALDRWSKDKGTGRQK